jgi:hypothetical protein
LGTKENSSIRKLAQTNAIPAASSPNAGEKIASGLESNTAAMFLGSYRRSSLNLDSVSLLAHEKTEKSEVCQRKAAPRIFLWRYVIFTPTENAKESRETGTQKEDRLVQTTQNQLDKLAEEEGFARPQPIDST